MLYKLRTGDMLLAEDEKQYRTNLYLITFEENNLWGLRCLICGELVGTFEKKDDIKQYIESFLSVIQIIPKETITKYMNKEYSMRYPVLVHNTFSEHELGLELDFES